jgi:hypothetical protein
VDTRTIAKLDRLLKKFPETWVHTKEVKELDGGPRTFHHVDYRSGIEGKPRVRLVSHVSSDMCELLVTLKASAADIVAEAKSSKRKEA